MKHWMAILLATAAFACPIWADIVHTRDGKKYEGAVTRTSGKIVVSTPAGAVELDPGDVILIEAAPTPSSAPAASLSTTQATDLPQALRPLNTDRVTMPESIVFGLMRRQGGTAPGLESYELRQQVDRWRGIAHDRKRKVGLDWVAPDSWATPRDNFVRHLAEAATAARNAKPLLSSTGKPDPNYPHNFEIFQEKIEHAASGWPDWFIRDFLQGIAAYDANRYARSEGFFRKCAETAPMIPAIYQGWAMTLLDEGFASDAVKRAQDTLLPRPESSELLYLMQKGMKAIPGAEITGEVYVEAKKCVDNFELQEKPPASRTVHWLMPAPPRGMNGNWQAADDLLPKPPYDRLYIRQARAVPISPRALLVDTAILKDAVDLYVQVGEGKFVPAYLPSSSPSNKAPLPLTLIVTGNCDFTPPATDETGAVPDGQAVQAFGVDSLTEMGGIVRKIGTKLTVANGVAQLTMPLLPGEAASPVLSDKGVLLGFLGSKADVFVDGGGPDAFIPLSQLAVALKAGRDPKLRPHLDSGSYTRVPVKKGLTLTPLTVTGDTFTVYAVVPEKFD